MRSFRIRLCILFLLTILLMSVNELRSAPQLKTGIARVNGTSLFYEMKGRGFPLVFISGGGVLDRRCWDEEFEFFAKYFRVIRYDVRGIGKSERPTAAFSHSRDLYALLKFLGIKRTHLIALSVGGAMG